MLCKLNESAKPQKKLRKPLANNVSSVSYKHSPFVVVSNRTTFSKVSAFVSTTLNRLKVVDIIDNFKGICMILVTVYQ